MGAWLERWTIFLFGTPVRCLVTAAVVGAVYLTANPGAGEEIAQRFWVGFEPLMRPIATMAITVLVPVPKSWLPKETATEPSGLTVKRHSLSCPRPPQVWNPKPTPRFRCPGVVSPLECHFFFHSTNSAAFKSSLR